MWGSVHRHAVQCDMWGSFSFSLQCNVACEGVSTAMQCIVIAREGVFTACIAKQNNYEMWSHWVVLHCTVQLQCIVIACEGVSARRQRQCRPHPMIRSGEERRLPPRDVHCFLCIWSQMLNIWMLYVQMHHAHQISTKARIASPWNLKTVKGGTFVSICDFPSSLSKAYIDCTVHCSTQCPIHILRSFLS